MNPGQTEGPITFPLTIRTTNKSIDEMLFKCPLAWTVSQLKLFVGMNHKNGNDFMRSDKLKLIYQGRILADEESLTEILKNKNIQEGVLIIAYTQPKQAPNQSKESKLSPAVNEMLFKDYARQLTKYVTQETRELNTNIKGLDLLSILPMRAEKFTSSVLKLGATPSGQAADFMNNAASSQQAQQQNNQPAADLGNNEGFLGFDEPFDGGEALDFNFHFKMIIKLSIFLFIFSQYFKGIYLVILLAIVGVYYWMKIKATGFRRRRLARNNNNAPQQQNNDNPEARDNRGQQSGSAQQGNVTELKGWNLTWEKTKELCVCFVCSLFPAWNIEIYIEERRHISIAQNPSNDVQNNGQNNAHNNAQPNNEGAGLSAHVLQSPADNSVLNREQEAPKSDNLFESQSPEERKEQPESEQKKENTKEIELADLQRFESKDSTRNDPLLD